MLILFRCTVVDNISVPVFLGHRALTAAPPPSNARQTELVHTPWQQSELPVFLLLFGTENFVVTNAALLYL